MADPKNKWSQPVAPPAPMFFGEKERDLVKQVNDELAERVVGQTIAYYPISIEDSNFNDLYGEAIEKVSLPPVRVFAYVTVDNEQLNERYGYEYKSSLTVNFHRKRLVADQNLYVRVGDFIQYRDEFYEIVRTYNDTRYYFGQVQHKFQITADCITARAGNFQVMPAVDRPVDQTSIDPVDGSTRAAPRSAPYPPVDADYLTLTRQPRVTNSRYLVAGTGITFTDGGRLAGLTIAASGQNAVGMTGSIQYQTGGGTFSGSANMVFLTSSNALSVTGDITASANMSASAYYGDGSNLSGITTGPAGSDTQVQYNDGGSMAASSNLTFDGTTLTSTYTGSLAQFTPLSASLMNLVALSGTLAGTGSYLGLNSSNNFVLTSAASTATSPAGSDTEVQFNDGGSFGASSNLIFDGTSLTVTGDLTASVNVSASAFFGDGSNLTGITSGGGSANAQGPVGSLQFQTGSGGISGSAGLSFATASSTLTVTGDFSVSNITASGDMVLDEDQRIYFEADKGTWIESDSTDRLRFVAGGNQMLLLDQDDKRVNIGYAMRLGVGLGNNTTPSALLQVEAVSADDDRNALFRVDGATAGNVLFVTGSGRVGIGTTDPTYALEVAGDAGFDEYLYHNEDGDTYIRFATNLVNVVAGGWSAIKLDKSSGKIQLNNGNQDLDVQVMADDGDAILHTDAGTNRLGVGTTAPSHLLTAAGSSHLSGGLVHKRTPVASNYTASTADYILGVTSVPVSIEFDATSFSIGQVVVVKDESGAASSANPITLSPSASQTIDGSPVIPIESPYGALLLYSDGTNWYIY